MGADGCHIGTVDHVRNGEIKRMKNDAEAGGLHRYIPFDFVQSVEGCYVRRSKPADEVKRELSTSGAA